MGDLVASTFLLVGAAIGSLAADQLIKGAMVNSLRSRRLPGATFVGLSVRGATLLWCASIACLAVTITLGARLSTLSAVGVGLAVGGACGNLTDRIMRGAVVDFIAVGRWTTFNLADAAMVVGVGLSMWGFV